MKKWLDLLEMIEGSPWSRPHPNNKGRWCRTGTRSAFHRRHASVFEVENARGRRTHHAAREKGRTDTNHQRIQRPSPIGARGWCGHEARNSPGIGKYKKKRKSQRLDPPPRIGVCRMRSNEQCAALPCRIRTSTRLAAVGTSMITLRSSGGLTPVGILSMRHAWSSFVCAGLVFVCGGEVGPRTGRP